MTEEKIKQLYQQYKTPLHVVKHCEKVAYVAGKIAEEYLKKGVNLDYESINFACLLHDVLKLVDFDAGMDHSRAAYHMLNEIGESFIAEIIKKHAFEGIVDDENQPFTLEQKIMTYADKRVLHENIVSLKERFEDGKIRYNPNNENEEWQQKVYEAYFQLEKQLFDPLPIKPEDIK